ncbi:30S ribosomal protein S6 [Desulfococcaceae bacterium HSG9]|nr:30S ribosomal protein S6 [Desulfococcaceae bacterium HSG9]
MRRYETIVIADPDLNDEDRGGLFTRVKDLIPQYKGILIEFDEWGDKRLAYDIKKKGRGYYVRIDFGGDGDLVAEMERQFRIDERVMKYMTVLLERDSDIEQLQEQSSVEQEVETESDDDFKEDNDSSDDNDDNDDDDFDDDDFDD